MYDESDRFESSTAGELRRLADVVGRRDPAAVVAAVLAASASRPRRSRLVAAPSLAALAAVLVIAVVGGVAVVSNQSGSRPATAEVNGKIYSVGVWRNLQVEPEDLSPYAEASRIDAGLRHLGYTVYALRGVDPTNVLLLPLEPGEGDELGSYGGYAVLTDPWRGSPDAICPFLDPTHPHTIEICPEAAP